MNKIEIRQLVAAFIAEEFLYGEDPSVLTDVTQLIEENILDSLSTIKFVRFLEETFHIELEAHEAIDSTGTIPDIVELVIAKQGGKPDKPVEKLSD